MREGIEETLANPHWSMRGGDRRTVRRVVTKHDHRVIVEASWYTPGNGTPVFRNGHTVCGDGVVYNGDDGPVSWPFDPDKLEKEA